MTMLNMYLNFDGNTQEAFDFYRSVFGGDYAVVMRFSDMPPSEGVEILANIADKIMHIALPISDNCVLMGSDRVAEFCTNDTTYVQGNAYSISITPDSDTEAERIFESLAEGGQVMMPLEPQFWGSLFGMLVDKFGIQWMVNYDIT